MISFHGWREDKNRTEELKIEHACECGVKRGQRSRWAGGGTERKEREGRRRQKRKERRRGWGKRRKEGEHVRRVKILRGEGREQGKK